MATCAEIQKLYSQSDEPVCVTYKAAVDDTPS